MIKCFVSTLVAVALLAGCAPDPISSKDIFSPPKVGLPGGNDNGNPGAPGKPPSSPYDYKSAIFEANGKKTEFSYVEVLERSNPNFTTLIFYTRAPRGMCNVSTLFDSSGYQPPFEFLKVTIDQTTLGEKIVSNATFGKRGDTFGRETTVGGTVKLDSKVDYQYQGWISMKGSDFEVRGNFDVAGCAKTKLIAEKLKLDDFYGSVKLVDTLSKRASPITLRLDYSSSNYGDYQGYVNKNEYLSFYMETETGAVEKFRLDFIGIASGQYLSLGNSYGTTSSPGPGIAIFEGNTLIVNDHTKAHMTDEPRFTAGPKVTIEYISLTDKHKVTVLWQGRELRGEF